MHIVLMILKILGILLLCLLGVLLAVILIVLLTPIRYQAYGKRERDTGVMTAGGRISWLLSIVSVGFSYDREFTVSVRVLGHRLGGKKPGGRKSREGKAQRKEPQEEPPQGEITEQKAAQEEIVQKEITQKELPEEAIPQSKIAQEEIPAKELSEGETTQEEPGRKTLEQRLSEAKEQAAKAKTTVDETKKSLTEKKDQVSRILEFISRDEVKETVRLLWRQIRRILRHILPQKIRLQIRFGLKDPAQTGQLTALMSVMPFFYRKGVRVTPVFDEACIDGEAAVRGRIRPGTCLCLALRILFSRNFWKLYKGYQSFNKE